MERREHRSGRCHRTEPEGVDVTLRNEEVQRAFKEAGCWNFCTKLKGGHMQVTKEFAMNFTGLSAKVGMLEFQVSPDIISRVTEIPRSGPEWFKNFRFNMDQCKEFLKEAYVNEDLTKAIPRNYLKESSALLLTCIQKYLTCEGRYNKVYSYHFKLLLHFTGKSLIDIPFYLFRSLTKMCDKVQLKKEECETNMFHHGLIKLMVMDSLHKIGKDWESFVHMAGFNIKTGLSPLPVREKESVSGKEMTEGKEVSPEEPTIAQLKRQARESRKSTPNTPAKLLATQESMQSSSKRQVKQKKAEVEPRVVTEEPRIKTRGQLRREKGKAKVSGDSSVTKASLKDLLEAIEFEQAEHTQLEPMEVEQVKLVHLEPMHIDLTQSSPEIKKKTAISKKLQFEDEKFVLKPRRPITRKQVKEAQAEEERKKAAFYKIDEALHKIEKAVKGSNKAKKVVIALGESKTSVQNQSGTSEERNAANVQTSVVNKELLAEAAIKVKQVAREKAIRYSNYRKAILKGSKYLIKHGDSVADVYSWTVPALKQAKHLNKINIALKVENRKLRIEMAELRNQLGKPT